MVTAGYGCAGCGAITTNETAINTAIDRQPTAPLTMQPQEMRPSLYPALVKAEISVQEGQQQR
jgi:hypothetical protein